MSRRKRRRPAPAEPGAGDRGRPGTGATAARPRPDLVPWRERARLVVRWLREWARDRQGPAIEAFLREHLGDAADLASVEDLERAYDDVLCAPGTAGDARSLVRAFAEEGQDLEPDERRVLPTWETERRRKVYVLDCAHRDRLELWDPLAAERSVVHLLERLPPARTAEVPRGAVVIASSAPWAGRWIALGHVEVYEDGSALAMYRREVRDSGRTWHDLPAAAPRGHDA